MTTAFIAKRFRFSAAHQLTAMPDGHKCARLHGHDYQAELVLVGPVDSDTGMVIDYGDVDVTFGSLVRRRLDHRCLGCAGPDFPGHDTDRHMREQPTAENIAAMLLSWARKVLDPDVVLAVRVSETGSTWAEVRS